MPTYVYACDSCGVQFEKFQSFKEAPLQNCPECSKDTVRRVFQPVGIVFKGSGWYITDSRGNNNATLNTATNTNSTAESTSETPTSSTESTTSESSTASTSEGTSSSTSTASTSTSTTSTSDSTA